jgi:hypothetical protein
MCYTNVKPLAINSYRGCQNNIPIPIEGIPIFFLSEHIYDNWYNSLKNYGLIVS